MSWAKTACHQHALLERDLDATQPSQEQSMTVIVGQHPTHVDVSCVGTALNYLLHPLPAALVLPVPCCDNWEIPPHAFSHSPSASPGMVGITRQGPAFLIHVLRVV